MRNYIETSNILHAKEKYEKFASSKSNIFIVLGKRGIGKTAFIEKNCRKIFQNEVNLSLASNNNDAIVGVICLGTKISSLILVSFIYFIPFLFFMDKPFLGAIINVITVILGLISFIGFHQSHYKNLLKIDDKITFCEQSGTIIADLDRSGLSEREVISFLILLESLKNRKFIIEVSYNEKTELFFLENIPKITEHFVLILDDGLLNLNIAKSYHPDFFISDAVKIRKLFREISPREIIDLMKDSELKKDLNNPQAHKKYLFISILKRIVQKKLKAASFESRNEVMNVFFKIKFESLINRSLGQYSTLVMELISDIRVYNAAFNTGGIFDVQDLQNSIADFINI